MNKTLSFIRLDFITVKPYLTPKNLFLLIAASLVMGLTTESSAAAMGMIATYAALYVSFPFAVGDKSSLDVLYATLSLNRRTVVLGRYIFALLIDLGAGLFACLFAFVLSVFTRKDFDIAETLAFALTMSLIYSTMQAVQLPLFFKLGYTKAKFLSYLPLVCLPLLVLGGVNVMRHFVALDEAVLLLRWFADNPFIVLSAATAVWLFILFVSYRISLSYYTKRDF